MKLNKLSIAVLFASSAISTSIFASGSGELHFSGQVVNAPCNIESESTNKKFHLVNFLVHL